MAQVCLVIYCVRLSRRFPDTYTTICKGIADYGDDRRYGSDRVIDHIVRHYARKTVTNQYCELIENLVSKSGR